MIRYVVLAAGAFALMSNLALAETMVVRTTPEYTAAHNRTVVKQRVDRYGRLVTVKKTRHGGFSGSSVSRTRTVTNPATGITRSRTVTDHD